MSRRAAALGADPFATSPGDSGWPDLGAPASSRLGQSVASEGAAGYPAGLRTPGRLLCRAELDRVDGQNDAAPSTRGTAPAAISI